MFKIFFVSFFVIVAVIGAIGFVKLAMFMFYGYKQQVNEKCERELSTRDYQIRFLKLDNEALKSELKGSNECIQFLDREYKRITSDNLPNMVEVEMRVEMAERMYPDDEEKQTAFQAGAIWGGLGKVKIKTK